MPISNTGAGFDKAMKSAKRLLTRGASDKVVKPSDYDVRVADLENPTEVVNSIMARLTVASEFREPLEREWSRAFMAWLLYVVWPDLPARIARHSGFAFRTLVNKYWVDEIYDALVVRPLVFVSDRVLFRAIDAGLIDGLAVNGTARSVRALASHGLKYVQSGLTQGYLLLMVVGTLAIVGYLVARS